MMHWNFIASAAALLLLAFLVWKEVKRPNRARRYWRLLASVLAVVSLVYLLLPFPLHSVQKAPDVKTPAPSDTLPAAIQSVYWQRQVNAGETFRVQGRFSNNTTVPVKLLLSGFNERLDSAVIAPQQQHNFELAARPRHIGRAMYTITALAKDTLAKEIIPVEVLPVQPLKILILAGSPDFENKFLASWLSEHNYIVAVRTSISRNKYSYAYFDTTRFQLERLTPAILTAFDLVVSDAGALSALGRDELGAIHTEVEEKGLGLIIRTDSITTRNFYNRPFALAAAADKNERPLILHTAGAEEPVTLVAAPGARLRAAPGLQALVWDRQQHILAGSSLYGAGRLVLTTISNTYTWMLSGRQEAYQSVWSLLLRQAARQRPIQDQWHTGCAFPRVRMPVPLYLESARHMPAATVNSMPLSLAENGVLPFRWQGIYWPVRAGWQVAATPAGDSSWWYAFDEKDWRYLSAREWKHAQSHNSTAGPDRDAGRVPLIWFLIIFMLSVTFLWAEEKLV